MCPGYKLPGAGEGFAGGSAHTEREAPDLDLITPAATWTAREAAKSPTIQANHGMPLAQRVVMFLSVVGPLAGMAAAIVLLWGRGVGPLDMAAMVLMYCI